MIGGIRLLYHGECGGCSYRLLDHLISFQLIDINLQHLFFFRFTCVFIYFLVFSAVTIYHEIDGCFQLIRYSKNREESFDHVKGRYSLEIVKAAFLMKMKNKLAGKAYFDTTVCGKLDCEPVEKTQEVKQSKPKYLFLSRLTLPFVMCGLYKTVHKPLRTIDEISGHTPFVTRSTWGLDTIYCRNRKTRYITVVKGESALTYKQVISSLICYLIGLSFTLIVFVAFMVWFELPAGAIGVICAAYIIWCFWSVLNSATLINLYDKVMDQKSDSDESEVLYQVRERFKIKNHLIIFAGPSFSLNFYFFLCVLLELYFMRVIFLLGFCLSLSQSSHSHVDTATQQLPWRN
jgi:hypothetical protein